MNTPTHEIRFDIAGFRDHALRAQPTDARG